MRILTCVYADDGLVSSQSTSLPSAPTLPSPDPIVNDPDLSRLQIVAHTGYKIAICKECRVAVSSDEIMAHAKTHGYSTKHLSSVKLKAAVERYGLLSNKAAPLPPFFEAPVPVLKPPIPGFFCTLCYGSNEKTNYACSQSSSRNRHMISDHPELKGRGAEFFDECHIQYCFAFNAVKNYFAVDLSKVPPLTPTSPADKLRAHLKAIRPHVSDRILIPPVDDRVMSQFLKETQWPRCLLGVNADEVVTLVRIPEPTEDFHSVARAVAGYFRFVAENVTDTLSLFNLRSIAAKDG